MIDIKLTEDNLKTILDPNVIIVNYPDCPAYKLRVYPGSLEDLGKPINCNHVLVQFKEIIYDDVSGMKFGQNCLGQINDVRFEILVQSNNLRAHREIYDIATAIIQELQGRKFLINITEDLIQGSSPLEVKSYKFGKVENGGVCYQSHIEIASHFTDTYKVRLS